MNRPELIKLYKDHEIGHINAEIYCLEERRKELELTPEQLRELAEIKEKLNYLYSIQSDKIRVYCSTCKKEREVPKSKYCTHCPDCGTKYTILSDSLRKDNDGKHQI